MPYKLGNYNNYERSPVYFVFNGAETLSYLRFSKLVPAGYVKMHMFAVSSIFSIIKNFWQPIKITHYVVSIISIITFQFVIIINLLIFFIIITILKIFVLYWFRWSLFQHQ